MYYGVSWYPEQKDAAALRQDLELLEKSGFNVVRMGEFAWSRMEPAPGLYDFTWLEQAVEQLSRRGIASILCTPTACPPAWLIELHPDLLYVDNRGVQRPFGGRRSYCYTHPAYRDWSARIATALARHFGDHPHVLGFQIDNEPAQEATGRCHCPRCQEAFRQWLSNRFGTIDALNEAGGMVFWSQTYTGFNQIRLPVNTIEVGTADHIPAYYENPSLRLWAEQFASEQQNAYQNIQAEALRRHSDRPITTNGTGLATNSIDYYTSFSDLDVYAFDYYPSLQHEISQAAYAHARGVKQKPFWLMEFVSGGGHRLNGSGRAQAWPGALQQAVVHAAANDAELVAHFQFRTFPAGAEQLNYAIVDADGIPRRRFYECADTAAVLRQLAPWLQNSQIDSGVALLFDYRSLWALHMKPVNPDFTPLIYLEQIMQELNRQGLAPDILDAREIPAQPERYRLLILPALIILDQEQQERLKAFTAAGGHIVASFLTSVKNSNNIGYTEQLPAGLTDLFGLNIAEVDPVFAHTTNQIRTISGETGRTSSWLEALELNTAEAWAVLSDGYRAGVPVVARHTYGRGTTWMVGTRLSDGLAGCFWQTVLAASRTAEKQLDMPLPAGCQLIRRKLKKQPGSVCFVFNFNADPVRITLAGAGDLLTHSQLSRTGQAPVIDSQACTVQVLVKPTEPDGNSTAVELGPYRWALLKLDKQP